MASFYPSAAASPPCVRGRTLAVLLAAICSLALMAPGASAVFGPPPTTPGDAGATTSPQDGVGSGPSPTLSPARYLTDTNFDQGGYKALFSMLHAFLGVVQSNELPKDIIQEFVNGEDLLSVLTNNATKLAVYEMGFLICLAIGLLYFLLLPFVAFFFCCCRCCGKCGGRRYQSDAEARSNCRRISYSVTLLLCCLLTTGGLVCMFQANIYTHYESGKSFAGSEVRTIVKNNLADINTFAENTVKQLDEVVAQYGPVKDIATNKVQNIGSIVGGNIQKNFLGEVAGPQSAALNLVDVIKRTKENLNTVNSSMSTLNLWAIDTNTTLDEIRSNLTTHLTPCSSAECRWLLDESNNISLAADFTPLSGTVEQVIIDLRSISEGDLKDQLVKGNETIKNITQLVDAAASGIKTGVLNTLTSVGNEIQNFSSQLDLSQYLDQIKTQTEEFSNTLTNIQDEAIFFDKLRFLAILGVVLLLAIIVLFFTIGLCLGTCGYSKRKSPANRGCCSNCGGIFLMAGVGFVFIFSWIFMFIVAILFFIGGNIHTLGCKPLADQSLFHLLDGLKVPDQPENATFLGYITNIGSNITITQVYEDCKRDAAIYSTLKMDQFQNLDDLIDIQEYVQKIKDDISGINVDLSSVNLLDPAGKDIIRDFGNSRVDSIPYNLFLEQIDKGLVNTNLPRYAFELRKFVLSGQNLSGAVLSGIASQLEDIDRDMPTQELDLMGASIVLLQEDTSNISNKTVALIAQLDNAQNVLTNISSSVVNLEISNYIDFLILDFDLYIGWIKRMIRLEMGGCLPVANLVDSIHIIGCSCVVDSLNGIWFGLGWALVFLFISLIFAVKLTKYFRRMKKEDVFESPMYTSGINKAYSPDPEEFALPRAKSGHGP
ncbi:LOW QUALITY PROTEIN: prominin-1-A-like [Lethenteron reissneri]|uniref:LOW QUALITY PROTEIN: prominin-1-A-like n=1 Tax=Lethenteron reissneri TaxID=7753 RepID=UPI002AB6F30F|nr:LOW QUALITY PROTEIN: prominin-1-A-like [Lethenteron reissneri]